MPYDNYKLTAAEYSQPMQVQNVLRWRGTASRNEAIHRGLPGSRAIDDEITKLLRLYFPDLDLFIEKFNGHLLRQYYEADGGSGFGRHIDEADDCTRQLLYLSVAVKLTDDPPGSDGTWMQVEGFQPVRYGCSAGSVVMFLSRWPHWSLRTPPNMGKVLKLVSFYRFREHSQLAAEYAKEAPADCAPLSENANRAFSVLPQQDSSQPQPQQQQPPQPSTHDDVLRLRSASRDNPDWRCTQAIKSACNQWFDVFRPVLKLAWEAKVGQRVVMEFEKVKGAAATFPFAQPVYGVCAIVRPTLAPSHSNQCEEFSSLALLAEVSRQWPNGGRPLQPDEHPLQVRAAAAVRGLRRRSNESANVHGSGGLHQRRRPVHHEWWQVRTNQARQHHQADRLWYYLRLRGRDPALGDHRARPLELHSTVGAVASIFPQTARRHRTRGGCVDPRRGAPSEGACPFEPLSVLYPCMPYHRPHTPVHPSPPTPSQPQFGSCLHRCYINFDRESDCTSLVDEWESKRLEIVREFYAGSSQQCQVAPSW